jgi:hypothetical protein
VFFAVSWISSNALADGFRPHNTVAHTAIVEAIKLAVALSIYLWHSRRRRSTPYEELSLEDAENFDEPLRAMEPTAMVALPSPTSWKRSMIWVFMIACLSVFQRNLVRSQVWRLRPSS